MRLSTDHAQWYDGIFDDRGPTFHRRAFERGGLPKRAQLELFDRLGLATPPHGPVKVLSERMRAPFSGGPTPAADLKCVVYEDELEHRGRGKVLLSLDQALRTHADRYATLFVPPLERALVYRHVRFGCLGFWLRQEAKGGDWQSNVDDDERYLGRTEHTERPIPRVLWAIDFVVTAFGLLAVDFNTAPELSTLGEASAATEGELKAELERAPQTQLHQM